MDKYLVKPIWTRIFFFFELASREICERTRGHQNRQHNTAAEPKADEYPTSHFLPFTEPLFNCCSVA